MLLNTLWLKPSCLSRTQKADSQDTTASATAASVGTTAVIITATNTPPAASVVPDVASKHCQVSLSNLPPMAPTGKS